MQVIMGKCCAGLLGRHNSLTSLEIIEGDVLSAMLRLITSTKHKNQLAGLQARLTIGTIAIIVWIALRLHCVAALVIKRWCSQLRQKAHSAIHNAYHWQPDPLTCCIVGCAGPALKIHGCLVSLGCNRESAAP